MICSECSLSTYVRPRKINAPPSSRRVARHYSNAITTKMATAAVSAITGGGTVRPTALHINSRRNNSGLTRLVKLSSVSSNNSFSL